MVVSGRTAAIKNPAFTFFANDVLSWEAFHCLSDAQLGHCLKLMVYAAKNGGSLPKEHWLLKLLDPAMLEVCSSPDDADETVNVTAPFNLPKLMADRRRWSESRKAGANANTRDPDGRFSGSRK